MPDTSPIGKMQNLLAQLVNSKMAPRVGGLSVTPDGHVQNLKPKKNIDTSGFPFFDASQNSSFITNLWHAGFSSSDEPSKTDSTV